MCFFSLIIYCIKYIKNLFINTNSNNNNIENIDDICVAWNNIHEDNIITTVINPMNNSINNPYIYNS
jgi:hypothetical protein